MKKFTESFSSGGYRGSLRILRLLALGLVALVGVQATALAQLKSVAECVPPTGTVTFTAETLSSQCYMGNDTYVVTISAENFTNVDSIDLYLNYDPTEFEFLSDSTVVLQSDLEDETAGDDGVNQKLAVTEPTTGTIRLDWVWWVGCIDLGDADLVQIQFKAKSTAGPLWSTDLEWSDAGSIWRCTGGTSLAEYTDVAYNDGGIDATYSILADDISYTVDGDACAGENITITVTEPLGTGYLYRVNNSAWTSNPALITVAGTNTIQVKNPSGCVSEKVSITHDNSFELTYDYIDEDGTCGSNGSISFINVADTVSELTYWVVPDGHEMSWDPGDYYHDGIWPDEKYAYSNSVVGVASGYYFIAVQGSSCGELVWRGVEIESDEYEMYVSEDDTESLDCYGAKVSFEIRINNDSDDDSEYEIYWLDDSMRTVTVDADDYEYEYLEGFGAGTHVITVVDVNTNCVQTDTVYVEDAEEITFDLGYTDAPCDSATGTIWLDSINGVAVADIPNPEDWQYKVYLAGVIDTMIEDITVTLEGLEPYIYTAYLINLDCDSTLIPFKNDKGDNLVPILTPGGIEATVGLKEEILCYGDTALVLVNILNEADGASYSYQVFDTASVALYDDFIPVDSNGVIIEKGDYTVEIMDDVNGDICSVVLPLYVDGPDTAITVEIANIVSPSCPGGNDGRVNITVAGGTAPYYLALDNPNAYVQGTNGYGLTEGEHTLYIKDALGCVLDTTIEVDSVPVLLIDAYLTDTTQVCADATSSITVVLDSVYADSTGFDISDLTFYYNTTGTAYASGTEFVPDTITNATQLDRVATAYYVWAESPWGCLSNMDTVEFELVDTLAIEDITYKDASCYGTWTGDVVLDISGGVADTFGNFYYAYYNNNVFETVDPDDITWTPFVADTLLELVNLQEGTYYIQIKDACSTTPTDTIVIGGYGEVVTDSIDITKVTCAIGGDDGAVTAYVSGGAPAVDSDYDYIYTLRLVNPVNDTDSTYNTLIGTEWQAGNTWSDLVAGDYQLLVADNSYQELGFPAPCYIDTQAVVVGQPDTLVFDSIGITPASCWNTNNGEIFIEVSGGSGSYELIVDGITEGAQDYTYAVPEGDSTVLVGVSGGTYIVEIRDDSGEAGCSISDTVTVVYPEEYEITAVWDTLPSDCNIADGDLSITVTGGLDTALVADSLDHIWYSLDEGPWTLLGYSGDTTQILVDAAEYEVEYDVVVTNDTTGFFCEGKTTIKLEIDDPFDLVATPSDAMCYGDSSGSITFTELTGGNGDAYQIQLVADGGTYMPEDSASWMPNGDPQSDSIVIENLPAGTYRVYTRDNTGLTVANCCRPIFVTVEGPTDSLEVAGLTLDASVLCYGDSTGQFSIQAAGGVPPYEYSYEISNYNAGHPFPADSIADLVWQEDSVITDLAANTYIVWVKDANGCIVGGEVDEDMNVLDQHRIVIASASQVVYDSIAYSDQQCYSDLATISIFGVQAGDSDSITFVLEGVDMLGAATYEEFGPYATDTADFTLTDIVPTDSTGYYTLSLKNDVDCGLTSKDTIMIYTADEFVATVAKVGSAGCIGDSTVAIVPGYYGEGVTGPVKYNIYQDGDLFKSMSAANVHIVPVGYTYTVRAYDPATECLSVESEGIKLFDPTEVTFQIVDVSCYGDSLASAKVIPAGTEDREFTLYWEELETGKTGNFGTFSSDTIVADEFEFDNVSLDDRHYVMWVEDTEGCASGIDTLTFDAVQNPLDIYVDAEEALTECVTKVTFNVTGGIAPRTVIVDDIDTIAFETTESVITPELMGGSHTVTVIDAHMCTFTTDVTVSGGTFRTDEVETWEGESVQYTDEEAQLDTMLYAGVYDFWYYPDTTSECPTLLTVTVTEVKKAAPELVSVSPNDTTLADNHPIFVLTFKDEVSLGEAGGITVTAEGDSVPTLELELTADMFSDSTITIDYVWQLDGSLDTSTTYIVKVDSGVVMGTGLAWEGIASDTAWTFTTGAEIATDNDVIGLDAVEFKVYPNPFDDYIKIDNYDRLTRVVMTNIAGQRVLDIEYPTEEIRTGNLVTGVYVISMFTEDGDIESARIIKR